MPTIYASQSFKEQIGNKTKKLIRWGVKNIGPKEVTLKQFARLMGIRTSILDRLLYPRTSLQERRIPSLYNMLRLCESMCISPEYFLPSNPDIVDDIDRFTKTKFTGIARAYDRSKSGYVYYHALVALFFKELSERTEARLLIDSTCAYSTITLIGDDLYQGLNLLFKVDMKKDLIMLSTYQAGHKPEKLVYEPLNIKYLYNILKITDTPKGTIINTTSRRRKRRANT